MEGIRGVGFDLDGTLYANYKLNIRLVPFVFRHWALAGAFAGARSLLHKAAAKERAGAARILPEDGDPPPESFYDAQAALVAKRLAINAETAKELVDRLVYRDWAEYFARITPFPHAAETLIFLKASGFRLGLLSDFPPRRKLELLGLDDLFDAVFSTEEFGALKPNPAPFEKLAGAMGLSPGEILYVGNSPRYDIAGAKRAGMKAALLRRGILSTGFAGGPGAALADFTFWNYRQLRKYVIN
ncbi:MAG: HAD family hydrolase [Treponema sp.]|jgi:putative hydrolase of the HAD superfamily|nr:HAD family hydrolase [Treponema sp.]